MPCIEFGSVDVFVLLYFPIQHKISLQYFHILRRFEGYSDLLAEKWNLLVSIQCEEIIFQPTYRKKMINPTKYCSIEKA